MFPRLALRSFQGMAFVALRFALRSFQGGTALVAFVVAAPSARAAPARSRTRRSIAVWSCTGCYGAARPMVGCSSKSLGVYFFRLYPSVLLALA